MGKMTVEEEYDPDTKTWAAQVRGEVVRGGTLRQLRSRIVTHVEGLFGEGAEVEHKLKLDRAEQRELTVLIKEGREVEKLRREYMRRLDLLNVKRVVFCEKFDDRKCSLEVMADTIEISSRRLQQMSDPNHYAGQRVRAIREGRIEPGSNPERGSKDEG